MGKEINVYPSMDAVESMDQYNLCKHYRFLRSPENEEEEGVMTRLAERTKEGGMFTPEISKSLGW